MLMVTTPMGMLNRLREREGGGGGGGGGERIIYLL